MRRKKTGLLIESMIKQVMLITALSGFVTLLGSFVDGVLIGRFLGPVSMSAFGLFNPFLLLCIAVSSLFMSGGKIAASNYVGSGKLKEANSVFCMITTLITLVSIIVCIGMNLLPGQLASLLGASKDVAMMQPLTDYIRGVSFGIPAMMIMFCVTTYLQIDGDNIRLIVSMLVMVVVNIAGDLLCIFAVKNGMFGMGLATSVSNIAGAVIVLSHFVSKRSSFRYSPKNAIWNQLGRILFSGVPTISQRLYSAFSNYLMNRIVLMIAGVIGGAAQSTRGNISALFLTLGSSLGNATLTVASLLYGEKDRAGLKTTQKKAVSISLKVTIVLAVIMFVFARPITEIYTGGNTEAMDMTVQAIRMFAFSLPFSSICDIFAGYYQAAGKLWIANLIPLLEYLVFPVSISYILGHSPLGIFGVWIAYPIAEVLTVVIVAAAVVIVNKTGKRPAFDFAMLRDDFGYREEDILSMSIGNLEQCAQASYETEGFIRKYSDDRRKSLLISIAVEELTKNIVQHGFGSRKNAAADLKLIRDGDQFILRLRDNCKSFNPREYQQMLSDENKDRNFGLRLVFGMISDIEYVSVLNMNNLKIVI